VNKQRRIFLHLSLGAALSTLGGGWARALDTKRSERFSPEERRIIEEYYHRGKKSKQKGLPPGLARLTSGSRPTASAVSSRRGSSCSPPRAWSET